MDKYQKGLEVVKEHLSPHQIEAIEEKTIQTKLVKQRGKKTKIVSEKEVINLMSVCLTIEKSLKTKKWEKVKYIKY